jgi:hypothetical protein
MRFFAAFYYRLACTVSLGCGAERGEARKAQHKGLFNAFGISFSAFAFCLEGAKITRKRCDVKATQATGLIDCSF